MLLTERDGDRATELIARSPRLTRECADLLPVLRERARRPATAEEVMGIIGRRLVTYPQPAERRKEEWVAWWADYTDALEDVPAGAIEEGLRLWIKNANEFMPKPGQLRQIAMANPNPDAQATERAERAVKLANAASSAALRTPATENEKAAVQRMVAEFTGQYRERTERKMAEALAAQEEQLARSQGVPDERGVTPLMRQLMARRVREENERGYVEDNL